MTITLANTLPPGRYGLGGLLKSEWTKLRSVRSTMWTLALTVVIGIGISALAAAEVTSHWAGWSAITKATFDPTSTSLFGTYFGQLTMGVLGALVMSAEYGTGTIRATLAAAPRRPLVLGAKVAVFGAVALVVAEVVSFLSFFLGQALLTSPVHHTTLASPGALRAVAGTGLYLALVGLFALGLATIIRHTAGAITAFVGVLLVLPTVVRALPMSMQVDIRRYLPSEIGNVMLSAHTPAHVFAPWTGMLLLAGYTVIGGVLLVRRDA